MRVCPNCGFVDPPFWKWYSYYRPNIDICRFEDFKQEYPKLAEEIEQTRFTEDALYKYRLNRKRNIVERISKIDSPGTSFRGPDTERPKKPLPLSQKKLSKFSDEG